MTTKSSFDPRKMDYAAFEAGQELKEQFTEEEVVKFSQWWREWYTKAGHKRLGRLLVSVSKDGVEFLQIES